MIAQSPSPPNYTPDPAAQPADSATESCPVCAGPSHSIGRALILGKHPAHYFECGGCEFIHTSTPHWLPEAYRSAISDCDVGLISRSISMADFSAQLLSLFLDPRDRILDFGAGYGITVRRLRDMGFDAWWQDEYCENVFAKGFEAPKTNTTGKPDFQLATAFEVAEHLPDPMATFREIFGRADSLLFSTELIPRPRPRIEEWDYFSPEHGQHVAFYSEKTLRTISREFGKRLYTNGRSLHLMTPHRLSGTFARAALKHRLPWAVLRAVLKFRSPAHRSRLPEDHKAALKRAGKIPFPSH